MTSTTSRDAAIQGLRDYQQELIGSIKQLQESLRIVEQSITLLSGSKQNTETSGATKHVVGQNAGPQEVVENFLRTTPGKFYRPRELAKEIQKTGYQVKAKKPAIWFAQVTNCLRRAVNKGIGEMKEVDGKKTYGLKQEKAKATGKDDQETMLN